MTHLDPVDHATHPDHDAREFDCDALASLIRACADDMIERMREAYHRFDAEYAREAVEFITAQNHYAEELLADALVPAPAPVAPLVDVTREHFGIEALAALPAPTPLVDVTPETFVYSAPEPAPARDRCEHRDSHGNLLFTSVHSHEAFSITLESYVCGVTGMPLALTMFSNRAMREFAELLETMLADTGH